jgi:hypothetical protein
MIKKLGAAHQEIADAYFEIKNWTLFHTKKNKQNKHLLALRQIE